MATPDIPSFEASATFAPDLSALAAAMEAVAALCNDIGYGALYALVAGGALFVPDRVRAAAVLADCSLEERATMALFALDQAVPEQVLGDRLTTVVAGLRAVDFASARDGAVQLEDLVLVPVLRGHLFTGTPPGWRPASARIGRAYLGDDSLLLARGLPDTRGRSVFDLGAGSGVQGLLGARGAARVVLTDLEPRSLLLTLTNALLNGVGAAEIRSGDGYAPVSGERFDLITALPPYVPSIPGIDDAVFAGGPDGLDLIRRLVQGAGAHLLPGGELVIFAQLLCNDSGPLLAEELPTLLDGSSARVSCSDWHPLQPYAADLAARLSISTGRPIAELRAAFLESLRSEGVTGVCSSFVRVLVDDPARPRSAVEMSLAPRRRGSDVLAPVAPLSITEEGGLRLAAGPGGLSQVLSAPVGALLAAFDGRRDVSAVVETAWGQPDGADPRDIMDQALRRIDELERAGFIVASS